ncbi:GNAT family N-acetyltransferase [Microbulbifer sp. YPW16]|uniref:GNAT family N-acetyltransferase n=1 Tax=Microbulbifer sp. YPW16 TaxID=2904242 RepID=UPI001E6372B9|nr:GNAT family N-acetyltransferase [Microbulbifer sp. YPW16]UHQ56462.1 GNAT family N-acetyltransferase [Microbulbifer sp. YPW16]
MVILETDRLLLSEFTGDDTTPVLAVLNDPDFIRNVADRGIRTADQARGYLRETLLPSYCQNSFGMYRVMLRDGTDIGMCGLVKRQWLDYPDIGFAFLPAYRGQGYAQEAARAVIELARNKLGLAVIKGIVNPDNGPSIRLLERLGLQPLGKTLYPGEDQEVLVMEWRKPGT